MSPHPVEAERYIACQECGAVTKDGKGWRAYLTVEDEDDLEPVEVVVLCPTCAAREFD
jgi:DNA-directed RNA polymerase subunit RPC12/RpoP